MAGMNRQSADIVIIGGGLAGAATAYFLTERGARDVLIVEGERQPGLHASGRNAAMVRQIVPDRDMGRLAKEGAWFIRESGRVTFHQHGSLLLGSGTEWEALSREADQAESIGTSVKKLDVREAVNRVPLLKKTAFEGAVWCHSDGVVDLAELLSFYLDGAKDRGARLQTGSRVTGIDVEGGRVKAVQTWGGPIQAGVLVNAAGAWAGEIGRLAGATPVTFVAYRRHLFVTEPLDWVSPAWPFVWDASHQYYFRPESGGLLLSPCDEDPWAPGNPSVDASIGDLLAGRIKEHLPAITGVPIRRSWAGLRTFTSDRRFVIGWDPQLSGFFWMAGLAGQGVTVSASAGALAADLIRAGPKSHGGVFDPGRFVIQENSRRV